MMDQENYPNQNETGDANANVPHTEGAPEPVKKQRRPVVLKFKKRFYDGEQEAELIKRLERRYQEMHFDENGTPKVNAETPASTVDNVRPSLRVVNHSAASPVVAPTAAPAQPSVSKKHLILQALFLGPLEISVAILGVITAGFALVTFACFKNQELNQHSRVVLVECKKAFARGIKNTIAGPGKALQHLKK